MPGQLTIPEEIKTAVKDIRDDKSATNFAVVGYDESALKTLALFGTGSDGVAGIKTYCKGDDVCYCLLRIDYTFETAGNIKSNATRFLFIYLRPGRWFISCCMSFHRLLTTVIVEQLPLKRKMMIGSVEGEVKKLFSPFIRTLEVESTDKLTEQSVSDIIDNITMTKSKVTDKKAPKGFFMNGNMVLSRDNTSDKTSAKLIPDSRSNFKQTKGAEVSFTDEEKVKDVATRIRSDDDPMRWCLFTYENKKTISFQASGEGDVSELLAACQDDKISYGLFRVVENYSRGRAGEWAVNIDQVKFGFITWVPETGISPILKAVVSTHKGDVVSRYVSLQAVVSHLVSV